MIDLRKLAEPGSIEETLLEKIDLKRLPRHIAVIMDGNGRWARARNLPRVEGHRAGIASVREIVETAARLELGTITLSALSVENETKNNKGLLFQIALNYGGRAEIVDTCNRIMTLLREKEMSDAVIDEAFFADHLYTAGAGDPDLLIRTSGELRVSNFLLWQIAYAEIHVTKVLWPDFRRRHLFEAIVDFQSRERRYGGVGDSDAEMFVEADGNPA